MIVIVGGHFLLMTKSNNSLEVVNQIASFGNPTQSSMVGPAEF